MFLFLYKSFKMLIAAIRGSDSPNQVAFGVALGMMIGLLPKDSLLAYFFGLFVFATSVNLLATSLSAFCFMWIAALCDPLSHQLGHFVLTYPSLQTTWLWLYEQPIVPWTRFNNTVVMGSLLVGLCCMYPVFLVSKSMFIRYAPQVNAWMVRFWLYRKIAGQQKVAELTGAEE